jgi:hypothetical protein
MDFSAPNARPLLTYSRGNLDPLAHLTLEMPSGNGQDH